MSSANISSRVQGKSVQKNRSMRLKSDPKRNANGKKGDCKDRLELVRLADERAALESESRKGDGSAAVIDAV